MPLKLHRLDQFLLVAFERRNRAAQQLAGGNALWFECRNDAAFDGRVNRWNRRTQVECVLTRPLSRAFLLGLVEDHIQQRSAGFGILLGKDSRGDLNQVTLELALVPFLEDVVEFFNLILETQLTGQEKKDLVAFLRQL